MDRKPSIRNFIASFGNDWAELMSGGFSVPFAVIAWRVDDLYAKAIFGLMAVGAFVFASYRVWASERRAVNTARGRINELEGEFPYSLRLCSIDYVLAVKSGFYDLESGTSKLMERTMGFNFHLQNTLSRPIQYRFKRVSINGIDTALGNGGEVISPHIETKFRTGTVPTALDVKHSPEQFRLELEYSYGEPGRPTRSVKKIIILSVFHDKKVTDFGYELDEETSLL